MAKPKKLLTERQKRAIVHGRHLYNFRRWLSLEGYGHLTQPFAMNISQIGLI